MVQSLLGFRAHVKKQHCSALRHASAQVYCVNNRDEVWPAITGQSAKKNKQRAMYFGMLPIAISRECCEC